MRAIYFYKERANYLIGLVSTIYIFIFYTNADLRQYSFAFLALYGFISLLLLLTFLRRKARYKRILAWILAFMVFNILSIMWAVDSTTTMSRLLELGAKLLAAYGIAENIKNERELKLVVQLFFGVLLLNIFYTIPTGILSDIMYGRQNNFTASNSLWNANVLGLMAVYAIVLISMFFTKKNKWISRGGIGGIIIFLMYIVMASGSRKAFLFPLIYFALIYIFSGRTGRMRKLVIVVLGILGAYLTVINVPSLYELIGSRLEAMIELLVEGDTSDLSMLSRQSMIEFALKMIHKRPLFGYGFYGFSYMYGNEFGFFSYSHNNYLEIMTGTGIIGVLLFYSLHYKILKLSKSATEINIFFSRTQIIAFIIAQLAVDFAYVSFFQFESIMLLSLCYVATQKQIRN